MLEPEVEIHRDEITTDPFEEQAFCRLSKVRIVLERYGFFISEQDDVLLIEDDEPTTYEEYMRSSNLRSGL